MSKKTTSRQRERGVALLMTMLALVLLSAIALGMTVSTNTETTITSNFRDKQAATFAAMAGLQEARDRIQPVTHSITPPLDSPSLTAANVIYLINPKSGETIAPWNMSASNLYRDTELCQENVLGLTPNAGVPCTAVPTGSAWRSVVDNSLSGSAPWNLTNPLDVKWTRISLKTNNMTPVAVNGVSTSGAVVCWDGKHQIPLPSGYGPDCSPNGGIATVSLVTAGTGYTSAPTVTIGAPPAGGIQATALAATTGGLNNTGIVISTTLTGGGAGYTSTPTVTLSGGGGSGATATATVVAWTGSPLSSISMTSPGTGCYSDPTQAPVIISGGGGSGATAVSVLAASTSCILSWNVSGNLTASGPCKNALKNTTATLTATGGGGTGFTGRVQFDANGKVVAGSPTILTRGTGYTSAPTLNAYLGSDCSLTYTILPGKLVASLSLTSAGDGYLTTPTVTISSGATVGAGTATLGAPTGNQGRVVAINLITGGSGYATAPTVSFSGGGGAGATGTTTLGVAVGGLTCCTITNPGKGYLTDPVVTLTGGGGTGATAKATIGRGLNYGQVYALTSLASTALGSRTMMQMEVTTPVAGWASIGALTIDGPNPTLNFPNSQPFIVHGADANSCSATAEPDHPAIAAYDNPNSPTATSSVDQIDAAIPRPDHYTGAGGTPSVVDTYGVLGDTMGTPVGLKSLIDAVQQKAATNGTTYGNDPSVGSLNLGSAAVPSFNYVAGDLTLNGSHDGYGVLVVTGTLHFGGNFTWHGVVLAVGDGNMEFNGGGNGQILGTALVAKIWDNHTSQNMLSTNGSPTFTWQGGGGNGVLYDHCWATNMMNQVPYVPPPSAKPLRILSLRQLSY